MSTEINQIEGAFDHPEVDTDTQIHHDAQTGTLTVNFSLSIRAAAQQAVEASRIEGAAAVKLTYPDGNGGTVTESFSGPDSPSLFVQTPDGPVERPLPEGAKVEAVRSARGAF